MITRADRIAGRTARQASQWFTATAAAALLAACAPGDDVTTAAAVPDAAVTDAAEETGAMPEPTCPVIESRDWIARVSAGTAGSGARLLVTGELDLPTPGYTVTLKEGPADRRMPPAQHLLLELTPPDGMVSQVVTTVAVRYEGVAAYAEYRAILVQCHNRVLATITEIEHAD